jgi:hypothetical protein
MYMTATKIVAGKPDALSSVPQFTIAVAEKGIRITVEKNKDFGDKKNIIIEIITISTPVMVTSITLPNFSSKGLLV